MRNGFLLERVRGEGVPCRFCGEAAGHLFWECSYTSLWSKFVKILSFTIWYKGTSNWPRCLLWHGRLPALAYPGGRSPWATASRVPQYLNVWTDGSLVSDHLAGIAAAGAGVFAQCFWLCWFRRRWGHLDLLPFSC